VADKSLPNGDICLEAKVAITGRRDEPVGAKPSSEPVLIVERDQAALSAMVRTLRAAGYQTTGVATFKEAAPDRGRPAAAAGDGCTARTSPRPASRVHRARPDAPIPRDYRGRTGRSVLEAEALRAGAAFVIKPRSLDVLVALVGVLTGEVPVFSDEPLSLYPAVAGAATAVS
jgi:hypothetical protein